jgi:hypothetical protein
MSITREGLILLLLILALVGATAHLIVLALEVWVRIHGH